MTGYRRHREYGPPRGGFVGSLPATWHALRLRFVASPRNSNVDKKTYDGQDEVWLCNYTDVYYNERITSRLQFMRATASVSEIEAFSLKAGDVIITKDSETPDDIGIASHVPGDLPGVVCGYHLTILRPRGIDGEFLFRVMQTHATRAFFFVEVSGVTRYGLGQETIRDVVVPVPPADEQRTICAWVNAETVRIDALIAKKTRFIELLREKRRALILRLATKGQNASVRLQESGTLWLGTVPAHWKLMSLARVTSSRCDGPFGSAIKSEHYSDDGVRVIRLQNIGSEGFRDRDRAFLDAAYCSEAIGSSHGVLSGDVLMAGLGDENNPLGRTCVAPESLGPAIVKADCYRFRLNAAAGDHDFVAMQLSATARTECGFLSTGSTRDRLNLGLAASRRIALPPTIEEQRSIVFAAKSASARIDKLIETTLASFDLLKERRAALITAAVTGQIDVRAQVTIDEAELA
jgi:type I restriction enzyme, S subunit